MQAAASTHLALVLAWRGAGAEECVIVVDQGLELGLQALVDLVLVAARLAKRMAIDELLGAAMPEMPTVPGAKGRGCIHRGVTRHVAAGQEEHVEEGDGDHDEKTADERGERGQLCPPMSCAMGDKALHFDEQVHHPYQRPGSEGWRQHSTVRREGNGVSVAVMACLEVTVPRCGPTMIDGFPH